MPGYLYSSFSQPDCIRLLKLLPRDRDPLKIQCKISEYSLRLQEGSNIFHPYEALSYVWGSENKPYSILLNGQSLNITQNLYSALLHLQPSIGSRIIWVDAICINQIDEKEKEQQIPFMAEIYAKARTVLVWLGEAEGDGSRALEAIRLVGGASTRYLSHAKSLRQPISRLLQRPWFQRIWVLQEVAAARHISIVCGSSEIDGYAFCLGLDSLDTILEAPTMQVAFLIRRAIFRPRNISQGQGKNSLNICSLGELVDKYHTHQATKLHDKIYALLGMCTEDLIPLIQPDYSLKWSQLMRRLVKVVLGDHFSVKIWEERQIALIKIKGYVLGQVSQAETSKELADTQRVKVIFRSLLDKQRFMKNNTDINTDTDSNSDTSSSTDINSKGPGTAYWILPKSAISIQQGDVICLLEGASKPTVVRLCNDHFVIVMITAAPEEHDTDIAPLEPSQSTSFPRNFLLVWNWEISSEKTHDLGEYNAFIQDSTWGSSETESARQLGIATRVWNVANILEDSQDKTARETLHRAVELYSIANEDGEWQALKIPIGQTVLMWAARNGHEDVVEQLLNTGIANVDSKDINDWTPLLWASQNGHNNVVEQLLVRGRANGNSTDINGRTPLSWAFQNGHSTVVEQLLVTGRANVDSQDINGRTPLSWASENGHDLVVDQLLVLGKADINLRDKYDRAPLSWAVASNVISVTKRLLKSNASIDFKDKYDQRPLSYAALYGHGAIFKLLNLGAKSRNSLKGIPDQNLLSLAAKYGHKVVLKRLLNKIRISTEAKDECDRTLLSLAAENGHEAIVEHLLEAGAEIESKCKDVESFGRYSYTALSWAVKKGHRAVVQQLLENGANVNPDGYSVHTPLSVAASNGLDTIFKQLLDAGADIEPRHRDHGTPLQNAIDNGHETIIQQLLEAGVDINLKEEYIFPPIVRAAYKGHAAVVTQLLKAGADIESSIDGRRKGDRPMEGTPLSYAAEYGHVAVVELLLEAGADVDKCYPHRTPLALAAEAGHQEVVEQLLKAGAEVETSHPYNRPLGLAAKAGHQAVVEQLLKAGADVNKNYPLSIAARNGHNAIVKQLLDACAYVNSNEDLDFPLSCAVKNGHEGIVEQLLEAGANLMPKNDYGETLLSCAAKKGHNTIVKQLLEAGVDVDSVDKDNGTPLLSATKNGHEAVVKLLLESGANTKLENTSGITPLLAATERGHEALVSLLHSFTS